MEHFHKRIAPLKHGTLSKMRRRKKYKHKYVFSSESPLKFPYFPGMTEFSGTQMNARLSYIDEAPYFENNKTYRVNNYTYGMFHDILQLLENQLNFSTTLYKRKDAVWGYIYPQPNGTYIGTGQINRYFYLRYTTYLLNSI